VDSTTPYARRAPCFLVFFDFLSFVRVFCAHSSLDTHPAVTCGIHGFTVSQHVYRRSYVLTYKLHLTPVTGVLRKTTRRAEQPLRRVLPRVSRSRLGECGEIREGRSCGGEGAGAPSRGEGVRRGGVTRARPARSTHPTDLRGRPSARVPPPPRGACLRKNNGARAQALARRRWDHSRSMAIVAARALFVSA
jgi:hypothetical protein